MTRVAVIGAGRIGTLRAHSCAQIPQVDFLAVCDKVPEKMEKLRMSLRPFYEHRRLEWMHPDYTDGVWG